MLFKLWVIIIVFVSPVLALAQSNEPPIQTKTELVSALCRLNHDQQSREVLLKTHPELVNSELWRDLNDLASTAYLLSPEQSQDIYEVAIQVAGQLHDPKLLATTYYNSGRVYSASNQFSKAVDVYEKSREQFEQAGLRRDLIYLLSDLGASYFILEDYQKAKEYSEQSIALAEILKSTNAPPGDLPDDYGRARALQTLADINLRNGDYFRAIEKLQTSLALYQLLNGVGSAYNFYIAGDLMALGRVYTAACDNVKALLYLSKAVEIVKTLSDPDMMASLLNSIGVLYTEQEDYAQAKSQFNQSLKIYRGESNQKETARVLLNLGVVEERQSNYDEALACFKLSFQTAKATQSVDVMIAASEGVGVVLTAKKDFVGALENLNQGFAIARDKKDDARQTELFWRSAQVHYDMGNYAQSATIAESAAALARESHLPKLTYLATTTLGQSYAAQGKFDLATQTLKQAVEQLEMMRDHVAGSEIESQLFLENRVASYHGLIDLLVSRKRSESDLEALLYAERTKGRVLLDVLSRGKVDLARTMTEQERDEEKKLNRSIVALNIQVSDKTSKQTQDAGLVQRLNEQLQSARLRYETFQDSVYAAHSDLKGRRQQMRPVTLNSINDVVRDEKTAFLEYVVTKERTYLFVLTKKPQATGFDLGVYAIGIDNKVLADKANEFRQMIADRDPTFAGNSRELYDLLIKPAEEQLKNKDTLCIVPDSSLWEVPFQALQARNDRYLLQEYVLYYAPSLDVLGEMSKKDHNSLSVSASLLAFGNPRLENETAANLNAVYRDDSLAPLPEAEAEVRALKEIWGAGNSRILIGADAGKELFQAEAGRYEVIHLATHGILDSKNPMYSRLIMARAKNDPDDDGLLEAREIKQLKLRAKLVVLSACQTARGRIGAGEGVVGISWAFFVAGVPTTVVSQWKVDSASTAKLMINFHQHLKDANGTSKAQALRQAALELLKDKAYQHPFYWAGFVMIGNGM